VTLVKEWAAHRLLTMPVIMMGGHATIETAVEATKIGAMAFLEKPVTLQKLLEAVDQGLLRSRAMRAMAADEATEQSPAAPPSVWLQQIGMNKPLREARDAFEKAYFEYHLHQEQGSMSRVAEKTGLERTHLYRKLKQLGVDAVRKVK
jgi:DNA-binding NtrC family response regulator